ncbi:hypothetical protein NQZ68_039375 [Dissostichus eleginoides]|nr:hypothetical protein NQZ68_039375 [Dissostichus eleginoides]
MGKALSRLCTIISLYTSCPARSALFNATYIAPDTSGEALLGRASKTCGRKQESQASSRVSLTAPATAALPKCATEIQWNPS